MSKKGETMFHEYDVDMLIWHEQFMSWMTKWKRGLTHRCVHQWPGRSAHRQAQWAKAEKNDAYHKCCNAREADENECIQQSNNDNHLA